MRTIRGLLTAHKRGQERLKMLAVLVLLTSGFCLLTSPSLQAQVSPPSIRSGASNPAHCSVGAGLGQLKLFYNTTSHTLKICSATDTWTNAALIVLGTPGQIAYLSDDGTLSGAEGFTYDPATGTVTFDGEGWPNLTPSADPTGADLVAGTWWFNNTAPAAVIFKFHDGTAKQTVLTNPASGVNHFTKSIWIDTPVVADSGRIQVMFPVAVHVTRVASSTKLATSTVTFNLDQRAAATPDTAGTNVLSADLVADTNQQTSCASGCDVNTITAGAIAANVPVAITISAIANAPTDVRIFIQGTID